MQIYNGGEKGAAGTGPWDFSPGIRAQDVHKSKKRLRLISRNPLILLARLAGFEPAAYGLEVGNSLQATGNQE